MTDLHVILGSPNGDGRRPATFRNGDSEYVSVIDAVDGWKREQTLKSACLALGLPLENLPSLGMEVHRLAREKDKADRPKERFPLVTSAQLAATDYTARPIITDCLYAGHPAFIGGMYKTLKTLIAIDGAMSIATGRPFLNTFTVNEPLGVIYFSGEGGPSIIKEYGERIAASKGLRLEEVGNIHWCFTVPKLESLEDLDAMIKVIGDTAAEVVFIDNTTLALSGDNAGVVMKMGQIFGTAIRRCDECGATPVFVHHFKRTRPDQFAPGELSDLTQAGAAEIAGQWWLLTRREVYDPDEPGEHRLWLNVGGRLGHGCLHALDAHEGRLSDPGGRQWEVELSQPKEVRKAAVERQEEVKQQRAEQRAAAALDCDRKELVQILAKLKAPETRSGLRERVSFGYARFNRALASLAEDGTIISVELTKGRGQHVYEAWRLRNDNDA
jgi:hypothetical protein